MPRKVYSDQFKRDAVAMYENDPQVSLNAAAAGLGEGVRKFVCEALI